MKILLSLLLFPLLIVAQPNNFPQGDYVEVHYSVDLKHQKFSEAENRDGMVEVFVTVELFYRGNLFIEAPPARYIPKHLNSLSLAGSYQHMNPTQKYQERLNNLLAVNDFDRPEERSFTNWLKTIPIESKTFAQAQYIPEGFGARISL